jgi:hypothetical protein
LNARALWDKIKGIRHLEWILPIILIGLAGSVLTQGSVSPAGDATQTALEKRLAHVLSAVEGAGRVEVIVHMTAQEPAAQAGAFGALPAQQGEPKPGGVIVVAEGADRLQVRLALARAVQTLLDLPASAVEVLPKEKGANGPPP